MQNSKPTYTLLAKISHPMINYKNWWYVWYYLQKDSPLNFTKKLKWAYLNDATLEVSYVQFESFDFSCWCSLCIHNKQAIRDVKVSQEDVLDPGEDMTALLTGVLSSGILHAPCPISVCCHQDDLREVRKTATIPCGIVSLNPMIILVLYKCVN